MKAKEIATKLNALAKRLTPAMDGEPQRLRLIEPGLKQLESLVVGLESKLEANAEERDRREKEAQKAARAAKGVVAGGNH